MVCSVNWVTEPADHMYITYAVLQCSYILSYFQIHPCLESVHSFSTASHIGIASVIICTWRIYTFCFYKFSPNPFSLFSLDPKSAASIQKESNLVSTILENKIHYMHSPSFALHHSLLFLEHHSIIKGNTISSSIFSLVRGSISASRFDASTIAF